MDSRYGRSFSGGSGGANRRYSRSRSRSRERSREHNHRRRNTRSRSRDRASYYRHAGSADKDLYRDLINEDYREERGYSNSRNYEHRSHRREDSYDNEREQRWKGYDRDARESRERVGDYDRGNERSRDYRQHNNNGNGSSNSNNREREKRFQSDDDSDNSDDSQYRITHSKTSNQPMNTIIVFGLEKHITEADIMGSLIQVNMAPSSIRLIRKKRTGASRGFAFVEFNTVEEATHWMELTQIACRMARKRKKLRCKNTRLICRFVIKSKPFVTEGVLQLQDQRVAIQYSHTRITDWHCVKCGVYNFKRRFSCFKCGASRADSESLFLGGGEGNEEVSNILTKKIMLRNLDALTNEEGVLTAMQKYLPDNVKSISEVQISRDTLTQTSRGICYLTFETLIDSMNVHNGLTALESPLQIDNRDISVSYCIDHNNRESKGAQSTAGSDMNGAIAAVPPSGPGGTYTVADVPRLAEYSASLYASTPAEHAHYVDYYTEYYIAEIKKGQFHGLSNSDSQLTEANSGAAVALSAIQRKQRKMNNIETTATAAATAAAQAAAAVKATFAAQTVVPPKGNDGKTYPTPDVSLYQYDETSGYYYDPSTGLYYDSHSQYYYNNESGAYLYWDQKRSTYVLATPASTQAALEGVLPQETQTEQKISEDDAKKDKTKDKDNNKPDKVKVAKKIVKDMEKWAKQLNQKKDYTVVATPQPILAGRGEAVEAPTTSRGALGGSYADVGFSILEKKERVKLNDYMTAPASTVAPASMNKLVNAYGGASDSDDDNGPTTHSAPDEADYVDFQKLTCLLCKRAFQSIDILQKHLKMSNLHKENMAKLKLGGGGGASDDASAGGLSYRDRAKERRLKYGESDPPPPNRSRERFEHEIKNLQTRQSDNVAAPAMPISSNNVGSRLLQKMGWSEGQGLGRKNQGRTQIIEADARSSNAGLGTKGGITPGDDYKTYIKKMMKSRYENA